MSFNITTDMYEGYIYKITNLINNKIYIGQTVQSVRARFNEHVFDGKQNNASIIDKKIIEYGKDKFKIETLEVISCEDNKLLHNKLNEREIYFIKKYDSIISHGKGYNITSGGNNNEHLRIPVDAYNTDGELIKSFESNYSASKYFKISTQAISNACNSGTMPRGKDVVFRHKGEPFDKFPMKQAVYKWYPSGEYIQCYRDTGTAAKDMNLNNPAAAGVIATSIDTNGLAYGFYWSSTKNFNFDISQYRNYTPVNAYTVDGTLFKSFNNLSDAAIFVCKRKSGISAIIRSCNGLNKYPVYGYIWRYKDEPFNKYLVKEKRKNQLAIDQFSTVGEFIRTYSSIKEAVELNHFDASIESTLVKCIRGDVTSSCGYIWREHGHDFNEFSTSDPHNKSVNCYNKQNEFVASFYSINDASRWIGGNSAIETRSGSISYCCRKFPRYKTAYGFKWFYADDPDQPDKTKIAV